MPRLALLVLLIPVIDFLLLIQIGRSVGFWPTISVVLGTGIVGISLLRGHGLGKLLASRAQLADGSANPQTILDALTFFLAGILLMGPGPIMDVLGLSLLLPPTRSLLMSRVRRWAEKQMRTGRMQMGGAGMTGVWTFSTSTTFGERGARYGGTIEAEPVEDEGPSVPRRRLDPAKEIRLPPKESED